jgi:hypothetical protein
VKARARAAGQRGAARPACLLDCLIAGQRNVFAVQRRSPHHTSDPALGSQLRAPGSDVEVRAAALQTLLAVANACSTPAVCWLSNPLLQRGERLVEALQFAELPYRRQRQAAARAAEEIQSCIDAAAKAAAKGRDAAAEGRDAAAEGRPMPGTESPEVS